MSAKPFTAAECEAIRKDFPILSRTLPTGKPLVYLDNAATSQKPLMVLEAVDHYYRESNANVHRGMHSLAEEATGAYESARQRVAAFFRMPDTMTVVFTRGTTEAINLVASSWGGSGLKPGDEIVITVMEHHSNIVPWQLVAERTGAVIKALPLTGEGELDVSRFDEVVTDRTRVLAFTHVSNALGTVNPAKELVTLAKEKGIVTVLDGAQSAPHMPLDLADMGCDFFCLFGTQNVWTDRDRSFDCEDGLFGSDASVSGWGEMIDQVSLESSTWADLPYKFEAGTPNMAGAIGWAAALEYLDGLGMDRIEATLSALTHSAAEQLAAEPGVRLTAHPRNRGGAVSFWLDDTHPHDVAQLVDQSGVAIRAGHVCCQPLMKHLGHPAINRASYHFYNTEAETSALLEALRVTRKIFGYG